MADDRRSAPPDRSRDRLAGPGRPDRHGARRSVYAPIAEREQITIAPDGRPADAQPAWRQDFPDRLAAGPLRRPPRLHEVPGAHQRRVHRGQFVDRRPELVPRSAAASRRCSGSHRWTTWPSAAAVGFTYPGEHDPCLLVRLTDERVRRLQPEVHAPLLRRDSPAGRGQLLLSLPRGTLRPADGRAHRGPAARGR